MNLICVEEEEIQESDGFSGEGEGYYLSWTMEVMVVQLVRGMLPQL